MTSRDIYDAITKIPLDAQFRVDNSHWYAIWVLCGGVARSARGRSFANLYLI